MASKKKTTKKAAGKKVVKKKASKKTTAKKKATKRSERSETKRARLALQHARSSTANFLSAFESVRAGRGATGAPTDGDQDLIRAAVVFAAGGLDITLKELIRGSLKTLAAKDIDVQDGFEKFARKQLRADPDINSKSDPTRFLAQLLVSTSPYDKLIESYTYELTGSSLQSTEELFKSAAALDISDKLLKDRRSDLVAAFQVRNDIIHELDVNFDGGRGRRQRKSRTKAILQAHSNVLLEVAEYFVIEVDKKLTEGGS